MKTPRILIETGETRSSFCVHKNRDVQSINIYKLSMITHNYSVVRLCKCFLWSSWSIACHSSQVETRSFQFLIIQSHSSKQITSKLSFLIKVLPQIFDIRKRFDPNTSSGYSVQKCFSYAAAKHQFL